MDVPNLLSGELEGVGEGGRHHDGGAVLVVVENGDVAALLQPLLDLKAPGGRDVLQVDAAEGAGQQADGVDDVVHILAADAQGDGVHVAEGLEQQALALHDGHAGLGADVAQAQHGGAVGDHGDRVPPAGELKALLRVLVDLQTGGGHAGGVGQGEGLPAVHRHLGRHAQLAFPLIVQAQGLFCIIHNTLGLFSHDFPASLRRFSADRGFHILLLYYARQNGARAAVPFHFTRTERMWYNSSVSTYFPPPVFREVCQL